MFSSTGLHCHTHINMQIMSSCQDKQASLLNVKSVQAYGWRICTWPEMCWTVFACSSLRWNSCQSKHERKSNSDHMSVHMALSRLAQAGVGREVLIVCHKEGLHGPQICLYIHVTFLK